MQSLLIAIVRILCESAIYLLFGFALAGVMHVVLRRTPRFAELLATRGSRSVALAALLGAPIPLCSCGVVPAAMTLRKKGASKGATVSFLISCPETDVVSVLLTYGLLGPVMAIFRPLAAIITAMVAGRLTDWVDTDADQEAPKEACSCDDGCAEDEEDEYNPRKGVFWNAVDYGFVRFFDDIIGSLLLGVVLGGLITVLLPSLGLEGLGRGSTIIAMLVMLLTGIPMYVCASASTPIAAGLIASGLSPGTALVFLLAGPATNLGSLLVLHKYLGRRVLVVYLATIGVVSIAMGLWLDTAFQHAAISLPSASLLKGEAGYTPFEIAGAVILMVLVVLSARRRRVVEALLLRLNRVRRR